MKKTLALVLALAMTLSLAVCGLTGMAAAEAPDEVTLWHYFDSPNDKQVILDWVEEYNTLQDDIHITATYMSRDELMNQYITAGCDVTDCLGATIIGAVSGELPDIGMVDSPDMASYISLGVFADITDQLEAWGELDNFFPGPLSSCMDADGRLYGLPQNSNCLALGVNMDLLKAAGYDHAPESLDELLEIAAATTDPANGVYGMAMCCISTVLSKGIVCPLTTTCPRFTPLMTSRYSSGMSS